MATTADRIKERRLERMRLGQAVCDYVTLPSDPEIRIAIVPLTEAQYRQVLEKVAGMTYPDDIAGVAIRDRVQSQEIVLRSVREEDDLTQRIYSNVDDMMEDFNVEDVDEIIDKYNEMIDKSSPSLDAIPPEELENVKKALQAMDWNALSGRAWYALKRFLSTIMPMPLLDNSPGSGSTSSSTTTSE